MRGAIVRDPHPRLLFPFPFVPIPIPIPIRPDGLPSVGLRIEAWRPPS
ncbi:MAG: hypothetical protein ACX98W_17145 [bacterium]